MAQRRFAIGDETNNDWMATLNGRLISVVRKPILKPGDGILAIGSCFAREIRRALRGLGYETYPKFFDIAFDPRIQSIGRLPERDNIHHYSTASIEQEVKRSLAGERIPPEQFWQFHWPQENLPCLWAEPHRRTIFGVTREAAVDASNKVSAAIDEGMQKARVVVLTVGLTETWRVKATGATSEWTGRDRPGLDERLTFTPLDLNANYCALTNAVRLLQKAGKQVILTLSPVPLRRTFSDQDVLVANMISKTTLRAVIAQICWENPEVIYWPSFEYVMGDMSAFQQDGRHVRPEVVDRIIKAFIEAHG